jgi:hypothetical protein
MAYSGIGQYDYSIVQNSDWLFIFYIDMTIKSPGIPDAYSGFPGRMPGTLGPYRPPVFPSRKSGKEVEGAGGGAASAIRRGQRTTAFF